MSEQRVGELGRLVQALDELALGVGLEEADLEAELTRPVPDPHLELDQRQRSVVLGIALAEHVEVHAVQHLDAVARTAVTAVLPLQTSPRRR